MIYKMSVLSNQYMFLQHRAYMRSLLMCRGKSPNHTVDKILLLYSVGNVPVIHLINDQYKLPVFDLINIT